VFGLVIRTVKHHIFKRRRPKSKACGGHLWKVLETEIIYEFGSSLFFDGWKLAIDLKLYYPKSDSGNRNVCSPRILKFLLASVHVDL
jgi:hypothetical protein